MNWFKRQWAAFRAKSYLGKFWDVLFVVVIVLFLIPDGRIFVQRMVLKTGLLGSTTANISEGLNPESRGWQLEDLEGNRFTLEALNNRPVFLNHWATWCPPCRAEMPSIMSLIDQTGGDAVFLLVTSEDRNRVQAFLDKQQWDLPVYFPVTPTPSQLAAESLPTSLVIDKNGMIIHRSEGMRDWSSEEAVELVTGK